MAIKLSDDGIKTKAYHAGLSSKLRNDVQEEWMNGVISVITATVSFGMGVDKSSVRFVVHWKIPQSVERYYQESGRAGRDGKKSYCRLYYSRYEKEQILFLLRKDISKKKTGDKSIKEKVSMKSFKALVEYCEGARCRHAFMSEYFGDKKPECNSGCDFCQKPKEVEEMIEQLRGGVMANKGHRGYKRTYMCSDFGAVDKNLYGGGKRGDDTRYSDDEEQGENHEEKCKKYRNKLIQDEFRKRKVNRQKRNDLNDIENIPGLHCKIKDSSNLTHIPKLAVKVREFCFERLHSSLISNYEINNRSTIGVEGLAVNLEYDIFLANRSSQMYKLSIQQKVKEINQSTERNETFSGRDCTSNNAVQDNEASEMESMFKRGQFVKASELLSVEQENSDLEEVAVEEQNIDPEELGKVKQDKTGFEEHAEITIKDEKIDCEKTTEIEIEKTVLDMDIDCMVNDTGQSDRSDAESEKTGTDSTEISYVTICSSTIKPLQGSPTGNSPKTSVLQTLKRPSISEDVQKIIAKREKRPAKSDFDIPSLPPLPSLTDSYIKTTFTAEKPDSVCSKEVEHEPQSKSPIPSQGSSNMSPELLVKNEYSASAVKPDSTKTVSQVTSSNVQPTSAILSSSSSCSRNSCAPPQTVSLVNSAQGTSTTTQSGITYSFNSNVNGLHYGQDFSPVFSLGTSSSSASQTTSLPGTVQSSTSNTRTNYLSGVSTNYSTNILQSLCAAQTAHAQIIAPQFPAYSQGAQSIAGLPSLPIDLRLYHGTNQPHTGTILTPSSVYFQHNHDLSVPVNVNSKTTPEIQGPLSLSGLYTKSNNHATADRSKTTSKNETARSHPRCMENKVEKSKINKKDCADIIVRYLTPYFRSGEVESKSTFKTLAKEMTERLVQTMGGVSNDKLRNTARSLVKVYFDEKRRKSKAK